MDRADINSRADMEKLVNTFYATVRQDDLLGPVFEARIGQRWDGHLEIMYRFWESLLFSEPVYSGNPFSKHIGLPIAGTHFERWISLFCLAVDQNFMGPRAEEAKVRAQRIAAIFRTKLNV